VGEYDGTLREIIHALKYRGRRSLARPLATLMCARGKELLNDADLVTPVPLHWWRHYRRGFNQARELAMYLELPVADLLKRTRHTRAQVELAAASRRSNVKGTFALRRTVGSKQPLAALKILLVDDVKCDRSDLDECAKVLKEAGACAVYALTAARVISRRQR
jgi:ComF family protein